VPVSTGSAPFLKMSRTPPRPIVSRVGRLRDFTAVAIAMYQRLST
jgi:hypothetical protein